MKKLLLTLGSLTAVLTPVATVVACGEKFDSSELETKIANQGAVVTNLKEELNDLKDKANDLKDKTNDLEDKTKDLEKDLLIAEDGFVANPNFDPLKMAVKVVTGGVYTDPIFMDKQKMAQIKALYEVFNNAKEKTTNNSNGSEIKYLIKKTKLLENFEQTVHMPGPDGNPVTIKTVANESIYVLDVPTDFAQWEADEDVQGFKMLMGIQEMDKNLLDGKVVITDRKDMIDKVQSNIPDVSEYLDKVSEAVLAFKVEIKDDKIIPHMINLNSLTNK